MILGIDFQSFLLGFLVCYVWLLFYKKNKKKIKRTKRPVEEKVGISEREKVVSESFVEKVERLEGEKVESESFVEGKSLVYISVHEVTPEKLDVQEEEISSPSSFNIEIKKEIKLESKNKDELSEKIDEKIKKERSAKKRSSMPILRVEKSSLDEQVIKPMKEESPRSHSNDNIPLVIPDLEEVINHKRKGKSSPRDKNSKLGKDRSDKKPDSGKLDKKSHQLINGHPWQSPNTTRRRRLGGLSMEIPTSSSFTNGTKRSIQAEQLKLEIKDVMDKFSDKTKGVSVESKNKSNHKDCFKGSNAVEWCMNNLYCTRQDAIAICSQMWASGFFVHVGDISHPFEDSSDQLFRFTQRKTSFLDVAEYEGYFEIELDGKHWKKKWFHFDKNDKEIRIGNQPDEKGDLENLYESITNPKTGVKITDRRYRLRIYKKCCIASEAVTWVMKNRSLKSKEEALDLLNRLLFSGLMFHVELDHLVKDEELFFRFSSPETDLASSTKTKESKVDLVEKIKLNNANLEIVKTGKHIEFRLSRMKENYPFVVSKSSETWNFIKFRVPKVSTKSAQQWIFALYNVIPSGFIKVSESEHELADELLNLDEPESSSGSIEYYDKPEPLPDINSSIFSIPLLEEIVNSVDSEPNSTSESKTIDSIPDKIKENNIDGGNQVEKTDNYEIRAEKKSIPQESNQKKQVIVPALDIQEELDPSEALGIELDNEQKEAIKIMIKHLNGLHCEGLPPNVRTAHKFLIAKNYDLERAIPTSTNYVAVWDKYGIIKIKDIYDVLLTGLIISPPGYISKSGEKIVYLLPRNVDFSKDHPDDRVMSILYWLQREIDDIELQSKGFMVIIDMAGAGLNPNILSQKAMIGVVQEAFPAKLKRILIVNSNWILHVVLTTVKALLTKKMQERIHVLKDSSKLLEHVDKKFLPSNLGGTGDFDHKTFLEGELKKEIGELG